ncbi:hypothetical protein GGR65_001496 [Xanthomonas sp. 3376]|nr:hypothetical protein [Xanthomonas arboricola]
MSGARPGISRRQREGATALMKNVVDMYARLLGLAFATGRMTRIRSN